MGALEFLCVEAYVLVMTPTCDQVAFTPGKPLAEAERTLAEHRTHVERLIVCGGPTQAAEDRLKQLERELVRLRSAHGRRMLEASHG